MLIQWDASEIKLALSGNAWSRGTLYINDNKALINKALGVSQIPK